MPAGCLPATIGRRYFLPNHPTRKENSALFRHKYVAPRCAAFRAARRCVATCVGRLRAVAKHFGDDRRRRRPERRRRAGREGLRHQQRHGRRARGRVGQRRGGDLPGPLDYGHLHGQRLQAGLFQRGGEGDHAALGRGREREGEAPRRLAVRGRHGLRRRRGRTHEPANRPPAPRATR